MYTWDWEESIGETLVTAEFNHLSEFTEVILTHERFPDVETTNGHKAGWARRLNRLEALCA